MRLEVAARALERARGARRLAAAAEDLAEVHESARFALEIAAAARAFELTLEVRLGALVLAAAEQRHAGQELEALAQERVAGGAACAAEVHQRLPVVPASDEQLGDLRLHGRAWIALGQPLELAAQAVQFLNFRAHPSPIIPDSVGLLNRTKF